MGTPRKTPKAPPVALLTHRPDPGLYSRLERAVEQLPKEVKVEGLENRLRKYPEGISGWELQPFMEQVSGLGTDSAIPRRLLQDLVRQTSPAFTHREGLLTEDGSLPFLGRPEDMLAAAGPLGSPGVVGKTQFKHATEPGGENYRTNLLMQPELPTGSGVNSMGNKYQWGGGHWGSHPNTVAHLRTKDFGDAVRIQELQSDIRNQNVSHRADLKNFHQENFDPSINPELWPSNQVPLYDAYPEVLLKSLLLRGAKDGKRAIEIAPFDAISGMTQMRDAGIQHVYGGQVPGTLIKAARPLGGLIDADPSVARGPTSNPDYVFSREAVQNIRDSDLRLDSVRRRIADHGGPMLYSHEIRAHNLIHARNSVPDAQAIYDSLLKLREHSGLGGPDGRRYLDEQMPNIMRDVELWNDLREQTAVNGPLMTPLRDPRFRVLELDSEDAPANPSRRLEIPDSVRRKIIEKGIGLGVLAPLLQDDEDQN